LKTSVVSGIILIIFGGIASKYVFDEKVELKFILSDRIPTSFLDGDNEETSVQQLELINTGDVELERVIIKIKSEVLEYHVRKIASIDSIDVAKTKSLLEIIYPTIPIEAKVGIIIKTNGEGISVNDLEITHSKGSAKEFAKSPNFFSYLYFGSILFYLILITNSIRSTYLDSLSSKVYYSAYDGILKKSKPWFVAGNKWQELRKDAIDHCFDREPYDIPNSLSYQILSMPAAKEIKPEEWNSLKLKAQKSLIYLVSGTIYQGISWNPDRLLTLAKPKNIDPDSWTKVVELISKGFVTQRMLRLGNYFDEREIEKRLKEKKPDIVIESDWHDYVRFLEKFKRLQTLQKKHEAMESNWQKILSNKEVDSVSTVLSDMELEKFKTIQMEIFRESDKIKANLLELAEQKSELGPLKEKLEKQLDLIHEALNDEAILDRIEDYSNPFSEGNFNNLKKLAQLNAKLKN
jgi:hypothetical protein